MKFAQNAEMDDTGTRVNVKERVAAFNQGTAFRKKKSESDSEEEEQVNENKEKEKKKEKEPPKPEPKKPPRRRQSVLAPSPRKEPLSTPTPKQVCGELLEIYDVSDVYDGFMTVFS